MDSPLKKIAILHPLMGFVGGAENLISWACEELASRGFEVTIFTRTLPQILPPTYKLQKIDMDLRVWKWPRVARELALSLKNFEAVIYHNFPSSIYYALAKNWAEKKGSPFPRALFYCHEPCRPWYGKNPEEYRKIRLKHILKFDVAAMNNIRLDKKAVRETNFVVGNSKRTSEFASWVYGRQVGNVYPGLPKYFIQEPSQELPDRFIFLSRLHWIKNLLGAIRAYDYFLKQDLGSKVDLYILGEGSDEGPGRQLVAQIGLEARVHFLGFVSNEMINQQMVKAIAILNVAREEPFGLVTLETWARRGPALILSKEAGSSEITTHGQNALLVDPLDPTSIGDAMVRLVREKGLRESLVRNGYDTLVGQFLIKHHVDGLLEQFNGPKEN